MLIGVCAYGLFQVLHSGITSAGNQRNIQGGRIDPRSACAMQMSYYLCYQSGLKCHYYVGLMKETNDKAYYVSKLGCHIKILQTRLIKLNVFTYSSGSWNQIKVLSSSITLFWIIDKWLLYTSLCGFEVDIQVCGYGWNGSWYSRKASSTRSCYYKIMLLWIIRKQLNGLFLRL